MSEAINITEGILDQIIKVLLFGFLGFALAMLVTPIYTHFAYKHQWWKKSDRTKSLTGEKPKIYLKLQLAKKSKQNTPVMAGLIFIISVTIITLILNLSREQTWLPLTAFVGAGLVGLLDDIAPLIGRGKQGLVGIGAKQKLALISGVALIGGFYFYAKLGYDSIFVPFVDGGIYLTIGPLLILLFAFIVVAMANAVNVTDGLDGLAGGLASFAYAAFASIALLQGNYGIAAFCLTIVGALLSYIWFNIPPARFYMGDVGSFALGTGLGVVAMLTNTVLVLPIIGIVFVAEIGSIVLQLLSKRIRGKKIFLSTPVHHHFEAIGWPETKVTMRFWIIGLVAGFVGVILAIAGGHV